MQFFPIDDHGPLNSIHTESLGVRQNQVNNPWSKETEETQEERQDSRFPNRDYN
jgi:hypothetical protein